MDDPTLLIHWLFSGLAVLVMSARLAWRKAARQAFNLGDYLTLGACLCCLVRMLLIHYVLTLGTSNVPDLYRQTHMFTDAEIHRREIGSKLSLANRVFYNSYLWLQKIVLLDVYRRLLVNIHLEKYIVGGYLAIFFGTYLVTQITTFSECKPLHLYWQVLPDPGPCAAAQVQLLVVGITNIVTDSMLLVLPIPLVLSLKQASWQRKARLFSIFLLGIFVILITLIRLPINASHKHSQINRTTWASTELLTSAIVVNAPTLYGLWNKTRRPKPSTGPQMPGPLDYSSRHSRFTTASAKRHKSLGPYDDEFVMVTRNDDTEEVPSRGILQTREVIVSRSKSSDVERGKGGSSLTVDDYERASSHSSQRRFLADKEERV